jgi:cell division protein ZapA
MTETMDAVPVRRVESVAVEIYDQVYHLRGSDPEYIEQLAGVVDAKMRAVSAGGGTVDSLRGAVLAALNLTDELMALRERFDALTGSVRQTQQGMQSRAGTLSGMLDEVLEFEERRAG